MHKKKLYTQYFEARKTVIEATIDREYGDFSVSPWIRSAVSDISAKEDPHFTPKNGKPGLHYNHGIRYCHLKTTTTFFDLGLLLWKIRGFEFLIECNPAAGLGLGIVYKLIQKITFYFSFLQRYAIYYSNINIDVFCTLQISYCSQMIANFYSLHFS